MITQNWKLDLERVFPVSDRPDDRVTGQLDFHDGDVIFEHGFAVVWKFRKEHSGIISES